MSDTTWTLTMQHSGEEKYVAINGVRGQFPTLTRGETASFTLDFTGEVATRHYGEGGYSESGYNARDNVTRFDLVRDLQDWAGWVDTSTLQKRPAYRVQIPGDAVVDSLVVRIQPSPDITGGRGAWGVVTAVTGETQLAENGVLELEVYVLAEADEYSSHSAVVSAFSPSIT